MSPLERSENTTLQRTLQWCVMQYSLPALWSANPTQNEDLRRLAFLSSLKTQKHYNYCVSCLTYNSKIISMKHFGFIRECHEELYHSELLARCFIDFSQNALSNTYGKSISFSRHKTHARQKFAACGADLHVCWSHNRLRVRASLRHPGPHCRSMC